MKAQVHIKRRDSFHLGKVRCMFFFIAHLLFSEENMPSPFLQGVMQISVLSSFGVLLFLYPYSSPPTPHCFPSASKMHVCSLEKTYTYLVTLKAFLAICLLFKDQPLHNSCPHRFLSPHSAFTSFTCSYFASLSCMYTLCREKLNFCTVLVFLPLYSEK